MPIVIAAWALLGFALPELPPLRDLDRLPAPAVVQSYRDFADAYGRHADRQLEESRPLDAGYWWQVRCERLDCRRAWDVLAMAQCESFTAEARRERLAELERVLGMADYFAGRMPSPVPVWRFRER